MAAEEKWYFTKEQLANTPSRKCGFDADKELSSRQQAANFIQDMGQRLQVTQLCINTAIVYMHRFYMFHSFTRFHRNAMAAAALFLAAKVEEQPRKLEHVIKVAQICLHREQPPLDIKSEVYQEQAQELVVNENILLQTLGFDVAIDHPHTHVVRCCHLVRASKDLAQTSYFMASNSLHLTTMCLQYKPTVVACFCIHLACKWSNWEIPQSNEGKPWFWYVDKSVTQELLEQLTEEFLAIFEKCPSRLKKKIMSLSSSQHSSMMSAFNSADMAEKKRNGEGSSQHPGLTFTHNNAPSGSGNNTTSGDDLKRKMDYSQRHHPENRKPHISSHHRGENTQNMAGKSSCMFGPPQRTQPPPHTSVSNPLNIPSSNSLSGQRPSQSHKPTPSEQRPRQRPERPDHHPQPYKKDHPHSFPQQPPTVEVPKPAPGPPLPVNKVERSIFSPEVSMTPEIKHEQIITRIKEEKVEEPPPLPPIVPPITIPLVVPKDEKIEMKQEPVEVKPEPVPILPQPVVLEEHHKEAKKKKKKHKEHKEKHKDKHKHKKDKHKEPGPIVITIPKEKLTLPKEHPLKIKIPKDKIGHLTTSPVKLKIPKEKLKEHRKRDRSESPGTPGGKRHNGAVQVTNNLALEERCLNESSPSDREIFNPGRPPEPPPVTKVVEPNHVPFAQLPKTTPVVVPPIFRTGYTTVSMDRNVHGPPRFHGPPRHRGRPRMRYHRSSYYQPRYHHIPQPMYQQQHIPQFQYISYIVPTFPPPPPLPDEPPPLPPPPPPDD